MVQPSLPPTETDISVLHEMVRLAENRRNEQKEIIDKIMRYNLGLVAFSGGYLSLLITATFPITVIHSAGFFSLLSIFVSLFNLRPQVLKKSSLLIQDDVNGIRNGEVIILKDFLFYLKQNYWK